MLSQEGGEKILYKQGPGGQKRVENGDTSYLHPHLYPSLLEKNLYEDW